MPDERGRSRVIFDVSEESYDRGYRLIPWGVRGLCLRILWEQLIDAVEREGVVVLGLLIDGKLKLFGKED